MILEGIVTTLNQDGTANVSPMGPDVADDMQTFVLKPYPSSQTYQNLCRGRVGVFHVTDNVEMLAAAAIGQLEPPPVGAPSEIWKASFWKTRVGGMLLKWSISTIDRNEWSSIATS